MTDSQKAFHDEKSPLYQQTTCLEVIPPAVPWTEPINNFNKNAPETYLTT